MSEEKKQEQNQEQNMFDNITIEHLEKKQHDYHYYFRTALEKHKGIAESFLYQQRSVAEELEEAASRINKIENPSFLKRSLQHFFPSKDQDTFEYYAIEGRLRGVIESLNILGKKLDLENEKFIECEKIAQDFRKLLTDINEHTDKYSISTEKSQKIISDTLEMVDDYIKESKSTKLLLDFLNENHLNQKINTNSFITFSESARHQKILGSFSNLIKETSLKLNNEALTKFQQHYEDACTEIEKHIKRKM